MDSHDSRERRSTGDTPCNMPYDTLHGFSVAKQQNEPCYIAAELEDNHEGVFIVGDNRTYGGYYNAPLEKKRAYDIWLGTVLTVDGVSWMSSFPHLNYV